MHNNEAQ